VKDRRGERGVRAAERQALHEMLELANTTRGHHWYWNRARYRLQQLEVVARERAVPIHAGEQDLSRPQFRAALTPLERINPSGSPSAMGEYFPATFCTPLGVHSKYEHLSSPRLFDLSDELRGPNRSTVHADLVCTRQQKGSDVIETTDAATNRERRKDHVRRPSDHIEHDSPRLVRGGDIQERDLVGAGSVVLNRALNRVTCVADVDEIDALDDPPATHVEARDDAFCKHTETHIHKPGVLGQAPCDFGPGAAIGGYIHPNMPACPRCGGENPPENPSCNTCGMLLPDPADRPEQPNATETSEAPRTLAGTGARADAGTPAGTRNKFARTMLGLAPLGQNSAPASGSEASQQQPAPDDPNTKPIHDTRSKNRTMLGLAFNLPQPEPKNQATHTLVGTGDFARPSPAPVVSFPDAAKGTLIGVAVPGIAPINPGIAKPAQGTSEDSPRQTAISDDATLETIESPPAKSRTSGHALLWTLSTGALALALVSATALWRWKAGPKLDVKVESTESGSDALLIHCSNCDDGVMFARGEVKAAVRNHQVRIPLSAPLAIGRNEISVAMIRGSSRPEAIQLHVPVEFRVSGDLAGLAEDPPKLRLRIEKTPAVEFEVGRTPVGFDANGKGVFEIDIAGDLVGPSSQEQILEKRIEYRVKSPSGTRDNALAIRTAVTPLVVTSPGSVLVTEGQDLRICGRTDPSAHVEIAGLQTNVGADGNFCNAAVIREFGLFEVWISAKRPAAAPRKVKLSIERTANLRDYAKSLFPQVRHEVPQSWRSEYGSPSSLLALTGVIVEQSKLPGSTRYLLKYESTGPASLARVNSFTATPAKPGSRVTVFGEPIGTLRGPDGSDIPELNSAFEVPAVK